MKYSPAHNKVASYTFLFIKYMRITSWTVCISFGIGCDLWWSMQNKRVSCGSDLHCQWIWYGLIYFWLGWFCRMDSPLLGQQVENCIIILPMYFGPWISRVGLMGKRLWRCTATGLRQFHRISMRKIRPVVFRGMRSVTSGLYLSKWALVPPFVLAWKTWWTKSTCR